jgi:hypothetical protein
MGDEFTHLKAPASIKKKNNKSEAEKLGEKLGEKLADALEKGIRFAFSKIKEKLKK